MAIRPQHRKLDYAGIVIDKWAQREGRLTDTQLYMAIGIPSALFARNFLGVLAAAFWQNKRFDDLEDWFKAELERVCSRRRDTLAAGETALKR